MPIFVVSHRLPSPVPGYPSVTFEKFERAMELTQQALEAGLLDELQIHMIPVLFGRGRPVHRPCRRRIPSPATQPLAFGGPRCQAEPM